MTFRLDVPRQRADGTKTGPPQSNHPQSRATGEIREGRKLRGFGWGQFLLVGLGSAAKPCTPVRFRP
jgi:hypothetical protein